MIILDTNVVSEPTRPTASETVRQWAIAQDQDQLYTTSITQAEMLWGVELMPAGRRRDALAEQIRQTFATDFAGRILPFDGAAAREFPVVVMQRRRKGKPIMGPDALIAAIARAHGAVLATRDTRDFAGCGIEVVNPWAFDVKS